MTDTADYADIVLPATTFLEHKDIQGAYGHYYVQLSDQAIAPLGEARSNVWLFAQLGQRIGFPEACFRDTEQRRCWPRRSRARPQEQQHPQMHGITLDQLRTPEHSVRLRWAGEPASTFPALRRRRLRHALAARVELYSAALAGQGLDPLPSFKPPKESRHNADRDHTRSNFSRARPTTT